MGRRISHDLTFRTFYCSSSRSSSELPEQRRTVVKTPKSLRNLHTRLFVDRRGLVQSQPDVARICKIPSENVTVHIMHSGTRLCKLKEKRNTIIDFSTQLCYLMLSKLCNKLVYTIYINVYLSLTWGYPSVPTGFSPWLTTLISL